MYNELDARDKGIVLCAGDVNMPTVILALASVATACNRYPQATTTVLINGFYPEYGPLILAKTQVIYACSIHPQYLDNSCRMCSLHFDQHRFSARLNVSMNDSAVVDPEYVRMVAPQFEPRKKVATSAFVFKHRSKSMRCYKQLDFIVAVYDIV